MMPGDQLTPVTSRRSSSASVAEPAESGLDEIGDAVVVLVGDLAIVEALHLAAGLRKRASKWSRPMMPSMRRLDRLGVRLHRVEQRRAEDAMSTALSLIRLDSGARASPVASSTRPCLAVRGEAAELGDELAHGAVALALGVMNHIGGDQPGKPLRRIPVRRGRVGRLPLASSRAPSPRWWRPRRASRRSGSGAG